MLINHGTWVFLTQSTGKKGGPDWMLVTEDSEHHSSLKWKSNIHLLSFINSFQQIHNNFPKIGIIFYSCANVRENTIASLKTAAYHGADMVEFDVQLSKDLIPVIYHDFHVSISLKRKKQIEAMDMLEIPVKDLTLEQLHLLKVSLVSNKTKKHTWLHILHSLL